MAIEGTFHIAQLTLAPGDVLVVRSARPLPAETVVRIRDHMRGLVPDDVKIMVIDNTFELSVLTRAEIEARTSQ